MIVDVFLLIRNLNRELFERKTKKSSLKIRRQVGSMVGSVANIILDPIFIFGLKQGAAGAAIATVLGNLIADIYYVYVMIKKTNRLSVSIGDAKISTSMIRNVLIIGIPASITIFKINFISNFRLSA